MPDVLNPLEVSIATPAISRRDTADAIRWAERVILAFFIYAAAIAVVLPVASAVRDRVVLLNCAVLLGYGFLIRSESAAHIRVIGVMRDWLPLGLILLAYREMGWFAVPQVGHELEAHWIVWDRAILYGAVKPALEAVGPVLPSVLEIAYALVYALAPFSLTVLYLYRRRDRVDRFLFLFAIGVLLCYAQFPLWPSQPPRLLFPGQDGPAYDTIFRRFNWWMLGSYGIHTSCFPSAHVAAAFSAAFAMRQALPERRWVSRFLFAMALLIAVATVYVRYHYAADAVAGFAMAIVAQAAGTVLRGRRAPILSQPAPHFPLCSDHAFRPARDTRLPAAGLPRLENAGARGQDQRRIVAQRSGEA